MAEISVASNGAAAGGGPSVEPNGATLYYRNGLHRDQRLIKAERRLLIAA